MNGSAATEEIFLRMLFGSQVAETNPLRFEKKVLGVGVKQRLRYRTPWEARPDFGERPPGATSLSGFEKQRWKPLCVEQHSRTESGFGRSAEQRDSSNLRKN